MGNLYFGACYAEALLLPDGREPDVERQELRSSTGCSRLRPLASQAVATATGSAWVRGKSPPGTRYVDLSNKAIQAGRLDAVTLGLNWYLNANAKLQFNYDYTHRGDTNNLAQGHIHAFGTRMQFDF